MRKIQMTLLAALLGSACSAAPDSSDDRPNGQPGSQSGGPATAPAGAAAQQRVQAAGPAPEGAGSIESVESTGTGCDGMSTTTGISPDQQAATTIFSGFVAAAGSGTPAEQASRNCLLMMQINVPAGWQYSLESVDIRGFAGLESGVKASRQSLYMIAGSPVHVTPKARFEGAIDDDYNHGEVSPEAPGVWSPCGGGQTLWIATQIEVNNGARPSRSGQLTIDTIDTELQWRACQ